MRRTLLLSFVLFACDAGVDVGETNRPIRFGETTRVGDFPAVGWLSGLDDRGGRGPVCTGSLISPTTVVTAAHCFETIEAENLEVYFAREANAFRLRDLITDRWSRGSSYVLHPDYVPAAPDQRIRNDIALVFLDEPVENVQIPYVSDHRIVPHLVVGAPVSIVGFGRDETNLSGPLRKANTILSRVGDLELRNGGREPYPSRCSGDSGAPTYMDVDGEPWLISVNSAGFADCNSSSIEARFDAYLEWVVEEMHAANAGDPNLLPAAPTPDAGVAPAPSLGDVPDAGFVELSARAAEGGCRCVNRPPTTPAAALFLLVFGLIPWRRVVPSGRAPGA